MCICREVLSGMPRVFDRNNVILLRIDEDDLNSFLIDMDIGDDEPVGIC